MTMFARAASVLALLYLGGAVHGIGIDAAQQQDKEVEEEKGEKIDPYYRSLLTALSDNTAALSDDSALIPQFDEFDGSGGGGFATANDDTGSGEGDEAEAAAAEGGEDDADTAAAAPDEEEDSTEVPSLDANEDPQPSSATKDEEDEVSDVDQNQDAAAPEWVPPVIDDAPTLDVDQTEAPLTPSTPVPVEQTEAPETPVDVEWVPPEAILPTPQAADPTDEAPVTPSTPAPVASTTEAPVTQPPSPADETTKDVVVDPSQAPVAVESDPVVDDAPSAPEESTDAPQTPEEAPVEPMEAQPTVSPTSALVWLAETPEPTATPTATPTNSPTSTPTQTPTADPTLSPTSGPTVTPTQTPTYAPTAGPTESPTAEASEIPSAAPTPSPTESPTAKASETPSAAPTPKPSGQPSHEPSAAPSGTPTTAPSMSPTVAKSSKPSTAGSARPSSAHSYLPSALPSFVPTQTPSVPPTPSPSATPSSAPSASPSSAPTANPSATPSSSPSASPTASPSGKPSSHPSSSPSASPSAEPSAEPSAVPSAVPSAQPSSSPTSSPSSSPTANPSSSPSAPPTPSSKEYTAGVFIRLVGVSSTMDGPRVAIFEETARQFVTDSMTTASGGNGRSLSPMETARQFVKDSMTAISGSGNDRDRSLTDIGDGVDVVITKAEVVTQSVTNFSPVSSTGSGDGTGTSSDLLIQLDITGDVSPYTPPENFSFPSTVLNGFVKNFADFTDALYEKSDFFEPLGHSSSRSDADERGRPIPGEGRTGADGGTITPTSETDSSVTTTAIIGIGAGVAGLSVALSIAALYLKRSRDAKKDAFDDGDSVVSPSMNTGFTPRGMGTSLPSLPVSPRSPNTVEGGKALSWDFKKDMSPNVQSDAYPQSEVGSKSFESKGGEKGDINKELGLNFSTESLFKARQEQGLASPAMCDQEKNLTPISQADSAFSFGLTAQNQLALTTVPMDNRYPMTVSQQYLQEAQEKAQFNYTEAKSMMDGQFDTHTIMSDPSEDSKSTANTRAHTPTMPENTTASPAGFNKRELYDCYAPPGPLGIVIDTTPEGPMIHSLKTTSQLLGLLNPGDLVVGLDDIDTRGMTAATLTRLMAKRSQQAQRKITLLTSRTAS